MSLPIFKLEDYMGEREFKAPYSLCSSDLETYSLKDLLTLADSESCKLWENLSLGYTEPVGLPILLQEVSRLYDTTGSEHVQMFAGAEEGIYCALHALLEPSDHAIVVTPCYQSLLAIAQSLCSVTTICLDESHDWNLDPDKLKAAIQPNTKLIIINFPHNPTGVVIDQATLISLVEIARQQNAYLFSDEVYRLLELQQSDRLPAIVDLYEKGISLSVVSKAFGLAGLRIGWIACKNKALLKRAEQIKYYLSICNSAPSEILALIALRARNTILGRNHQLMMGNLVLLDNFLERYSNVFHWIRPRGGCIGFPRLLSKQSIDIFADELLAEEGVLLLPGSVFDYPGNNFRISYGRRNMPDALSRLERFIG